MKLINKLFRKIYRYNQYKPYFKKLTKKYAINKDDYQIDELCKFEQFMNLPEEQFNKFSTNIGEILPNYFRGKVFPYDTNYILIPWYEYYRLIYYGPIHRGLSLNLNNWMITKDKDMISEFPFYIVNFTWFYNFTPSTNILINFYGIINDNYGLTRTVQIPKIKEFKTGHPSQQEILYSVYKIEESDLELREGELFGVLNGVPYYSFTSSEYVNDVILSVAFPKDTQYTKEARKVLTTLSQETTESFFCDDNEKKIYFFKTKWNYVNSPFTPLQINTANYNIIYEVSAPYKGGGALQEVIQYTGSISKDYISDSYDETVNTYGSCGNHSNLAKSVRTKYKQKFVLQYYYLPEDEENYKEAYVDGEILETHYHYYNNRAILKLKFTVNETRLSYPYLVRVYRYDIEVNTKTYDICTGELLSDVTTHPAPYYIDGLHTWSQAFNTIRMKPILPPTEHIAADTYALKPRIPGLGTEKWAKFSTNNYTSHTEADFNVFQTSYAKIPYLDETTQIEYKKNQIIKRTTPEKILASTNNTILLETYLTIYDPILIPLGSATFKVSCYCDCYFLRSEIWWSNNNSLQSYSFEEFMRSDFVARTIYFRNAPINFYKTNNIYNNTECLGIPFNIDEIMQKIEENNINQNNASECLEFLLNYIKQPKNQFVIKDFNPNDWIFVNVLPMATNEFFDSYYPRYPLLNLYNGQSWRYFKKPVKPY